MSDLGEIYVLQSTSVSITKGTTYHTSKVWDGMGMNRAVDIYFQVITTGVHSAADASVDAIIERSYDRSHWITIWSTTRVVASAISSTAWFTNSMGPVTPYFRSRVRARMADGKSTDVVKVNLSIIGYPG